MCQKCGKKYKTKGGYERHQASKHSERADHEVPFDSAVLNELVNNTVFKLKENKAHSEMLRQELSSYLFESPDEDRYNQLRDIFEGYTKNGSVEKFYGKYYATVAVNSVTFFRGLTQNAATLLAVKVADSLLAYCNKVRSPSESSKELNTVLSDRDKSCIQYLGGYVLHNLHNKHRTKTSSESQQAMAILKAGKSETSDLSQNLISSVTRGGLWFITQPAQKIFCQTEYFFREATSQVGLQKIDFPSIISKSISDSIIVSQYNIMLLEAEIEPVSHISKSVLYSIIHLYVQVRSFSLAKDIVECHKIKVKKNKAKSLRKEISRSCDDQEQANGRQD